MREEGESKRPWEECGASVAGPAARPQGDAGILRCWLAICADFLFLALPYSVFTLNSWSARKQIETFLLLRPHTPATSVFTTSVKSVAASDYCRLGRTRVMRHFHEPYYRRPRAITVMCWKRRSSGLVPRTLSIALHHHRCLRPRTLTQLIRRARLSLESGHSRFSARHRRPRQLLVARVPSSLERACLLPKQRAHVRALKPLFLPGGYAAPTPHAPSRPLSQSWSLLFCD